MLKEIIINNNKYTFVCNWVRARNGFRHDCTLYFNGTEVKKAKCNYLNRTWESYQFQTVMQSAISDYIEKIKNELIQRYKIANNVDRMRKATKDMIFKDDNLLNELKSVYKQL